MTSLYQPSVAGCCTANGAQGYYYAWHGITRFDQGVATVNLFLNRASPWMDIDSHLPYAGKVVLHNKTAHTAFTTAFPVGSTATRSVFAHARLHRRRQRPCRRRWAICWS
ncbi:MAG: hypothetical protein U0992_13505 [Planctomycetaceae bacterium]